MHTAVTHNTRKRWMLTVAVSAALIVVVVVVLLIRSSGPGRAGQRVFGAGFDPFLVLSAPHPGDRHRLSEKDARYALAHPTASPPWRTLHSHLVVFGFARVTVAGAFLPEQRAFWRKYSDRPAWVGVYEARWTDVEVTECGAGAQPVPEGKPPANYYYADIIDPDTGHQVFWIDGNIRLIIQWQCSTHRAPL